MTTSVSAVPDDVEALKATLVAERAAHAAKVERLRPIIKALQRHRFGRRAETLPVDQLELALEDVEQVEAEGEAQVEATKPEAKTEHAKPFHPGPRT